MIVIILPLDDYNLYLFHEGKHECCYNLLGAHLTEQKKQAGVEFRVWAPRAEMVWVIGDFNSWQIGITPMKKTVDIWQVFVPEITLGVRYKYAIRTMEGKILIKADPFAFYAENRPNTASIVADITCYKWQDQEWMNSRPNKSLINNPVNIYELHAGSWQKNKNNDFLSYRELAERVIPYIKDMGYTHIELMPIAEHPLDNSWGYQVTGYYAVTSRYGSIEDFMYFVDKCHQNNIGVIIDWVGAHFCKDDHGLRCFDGMPLYEHADKRRSENKDWGTSYFDLSRFEVRSFLCSNALFWLKECHADGLRVDAVASMLYLNYGKKEGEYLPNEQGGIENTAAAEFFKSLNAAVGRNCPGAVMIAEESTTYPKVTASLSSGGLGFSFKWNMGWMNDILTYMQINPLYRRHGHDKLTFSLMYAFSENFILPLSHDEVVHGKKTLLDKMPGSYEQKFANLRLLYGFMMAHPGKKLLFMGQEFGQFAEWDENKQLDWNLLDYDLHRLLKRYVKALNHLYLAQKALWQLDNSWDGFEWLDVDNDNKSIISFIRRSKENQDYIIVVCNFTPIVRAHYRIGVPADRVYQEVFNSDDAGFGGSGFKTKKKIHAERIPQHNKPYSLSLDVGPLAVLYLKEGKQCEKKIALQ